MASNTICTPCLRALRQQLQSHSNTMVRTRRRDLPSTTKITTNTTTSPRAFSATQKPSDKGAIRFNVPGHESGETQTPDAFRKLASNLRQSQTFRAATEPYVAYGGTEHLYLLSSSSTDYTIPSRHNAPTQPAPTNAAGEDVGVPADPNSFWYAPRIQGGLGLDVTFYTWAQVVFLHMYMLTVRLRTFPAEHAKIWHQQLLDHFFYAAEDRMAVWHNMSARGIRNKYLKDLWQQWRGIIFSYDEGLIKGDAVMAGAVWRNLFKGDMNVDIGDVAVVVAYLTRELKMLDSLRDEVLAEARFAFGDPRTLAAVLGKESVLVKKPFEQVEKEALPAQ